MRQAEERRRHRAVNEFPTEPRRPRPHIARARAGGHHGGRLLDVPPRSAGVLQEPPGPSRRSSPPDGRHRHGWTRSRRSPPRADRNWNGSDHRKGTRPAMRALSFFLLGCSRRPRGSGAGDGDPYLRGDEGKPPRKAPDDPYCGSSSITAEASRARSPEHDPKFFLSPGGKTTGGGVAAHATGCSTTRRSRTPSARFRPCTLADPKLGLTVPASRARALPRGQHPEHHRRASGRWCSRPGRQFAGVDVRATRSCGSSRVPGPRCWPTRSTTPPSRTRGRRLAFTSRVAWGDTTAPIPSCRLRKCGNNASIDQRDCGSTG